MKAEIDRYGTMTVAPFHKGENFALAQWVELFKSGDVQLCVEYESANDGQQRLVIRDGRRAATVTP